MTDPIADMLTRIKNALAVKKPQVLIPFSKIKFAIAKILEKENLVEKVEEKFFRKRKRGKKFPYILITLKYKENEPVIRELKRISKPGRRIYVKSKELKPKKYKISILSTSSGIMTDHQAKKRRLGGELLCEIW